MRTEAGGEVIALLLLALSCGSERQQVKTLADPAAERIAFAPLADTVERLAHRPYVRPGNKPRGVSPEETRVYVVEGIVRVVKHEADQDIHIAIADLRTRDTMIVEAVSPSCAHGLRRPAIAAVRPVAEGLRVGQRVRVTGVGFHDMAHGQTGAAPSGLELHPILSLAVLNAVERSR